MGRFVSYCIVVVAIILSAAPFISGGISGKDIALGYGLLWFGVILAAPFLLGQPMMFGAVPVDPTDQNLWFRIFGFGVGIVIYVLGASGLIHAVV